LRCGDLVAMVTDSAHVTVVTTIRVLRVDTTTLRQLVFKAVGLILFVLVVFIVAALESVKDVEDAHLTSTDVI